jgi:hypothetical protein
MFLRYRHLAILASTLSYFATLTDAFAAGYVKNKTSLSENYKHGTIELALMNVNQDYFNEQRRKYIYFGNWLRDYSLVLAPVEATSPTSANLKDKLIIKLLSAKARRTFGKEGVFKVTAKNLGRSDQMEHLDNPYVSMSKQETEATQIDPTTGLKNYMVKSGQPYKSAMDYIQSQFTETVTLLRTNEAEALRHFGQALHTIEDFYAHSNFIEMALRLQGHTNVFNWVGKDTEITLNGKRTFPIVTGCAGLTRMSVNLMSLLKDEVIELAPETGGRSDSAVSSCFSSLRCRFKMGLMSFNTKVLSSFLQTLQKRIAHQTERDDEIFTDTRSTNPTHSQMSKDHLDHPLNSLAGLCASQAVRELGSALWQISRLRRIDTPVALNTLMTVVRSLFQHPETMALRPDNSIEANMLKIVKTWSEKPGSAQNIAKVNEAAARKGDLTLIAAD